jgi:hypothetical protein
MLQEMLCRRRLPYPQTWTRPVPYPAYLSRKYCSGAVSPVALVLLGAPLGDARCHGSGFFVLFSAHNLARTCQESESVLT